MAQLSGEPSALPAKRDNRKLPKGLTKYRSQAVVDTIKLSNIDGNKTEAPVLITNYRYITSYNWLGLKSPTILVPGCPSLWTPPAMPIELKTDTGLFYIDQNSARCKSLSAMAPVFAALQATFPAGNGETADLRSFDLITDRSNLRKLFYFVSGQVDSGWRIDVEMVEGTMVFTRCEAENKTMIPKKSAHGYGHNFEEKFLKYGHAVSGSTGHHQVAAYEIGGMKWMVRFEVDGYFGDAASEDESPSHLESINLETSQTFESILGLKVIHAGSAVPTSSILEVKTLSNAKVSFRPEWNAQLYFSQTKNIIVARHKDGVFAQSGINKIQAHERIQTWEKMELNQKKLRTMLRLIGNIRDIVNGMEGKKAVLWCEKGLLGANKGDINVHGYTGPGLRLGSEMIENLWGSEVEMTHHA